MDRSIFYLNLSIFIKIAIGSADGNCRIGAFSDSGAESAVRTGYDAVKYIIVFIRIGKIAA